MIKQVYLDNHTATRPYPQALEAMLPFYQEKWGAASAPYQMGQEAVSGVLQSTDEIMQELGAGKEDQFFFCSSGAEAVGSVFFSHYLEEVRDSGKNHILTTNVEEAPTFLGLKRLEKFHCVEKVLPVNSQGQMTRQVLEEAIKPRTSLLSLAWANSLTGVIHPIADIAQACKEKGIRLHVDASTVIGKLFFHFEDLNVDYLTFDGSLFHSPKGTAGLLVKGGIAFHPLIAGNPNVHVGGVAALARALGESSRYFDQINLETARLRREFEQGVVSGFPEAVVLFQDVERLPNTAVIAFPGVDSDALLYLLSRRGVYASMGGGQAQKLFYLLTASQVDEGLARCALSFSLSYETTEEEIAYAVQMIAECAIKLKKCSANVWRSGA